MARFPLRPFGAVLFAFLFQPAVTGEVLWEKHNPLPTGDLLNSVWGSSANNVFAVGMSGTILRWDGTSWSAMMTRTTSHLRAIWGDSATSAFAVGDGGTILRWDGYTWYPMTSGTIRHLYGVGGTSATNVFAVGMGGTILRWNGSDWTSMTSGTNQHLRGVWASSKASVYAVGDGGTILYGTGLVWSPVTSGTTENLNAVGGTPAGDVFAVGNRGTIVHYKFIAVPPPGESRHEWVLETAGTNSDFYSVWGSSATNVLAVGFGGLAKVYDGTSWSGATPSTGTTADLRGLWGSSATNVFAVGDWGKIFHFDGTAWTSMVYGTTYDLYGIWGSSATNVFAVGNSGRIMRWQGTVWDTMTSGTSADLRAIWGSSENNVLVGGAQGTIRRWNGTAWSSMSTGTTAWIYGIWGSSDNDVWAVGQGGLILHWNGTAWSSVTSQTTKDLRSVWGSSSTDVFAVGDAGTIVRWNGTAWNPMASGVTEDLHGVWGKWGMIRTGIPEEVFAIGSFGQVLHYNVTFWSSIAWSEIRHNDAVWGTSPTNFFVVGSGGTISAGMVTWGGTIFTALKSGTSADLHAVWGSSNTDVWVVGEGATILRRVETSCVSYLDPPNAVFGCPGGEASFLVPVTTGCDRSAASEAPWITVTSQGSGEELAAVRYTVAKNVGARRTGSIRVGGRRFWVGQSDGSACQVPFTLYFPQIGVGPIGQDELRTVLLLVNASDEPAAGVVLALFNEEGEPLQVTVNQQAWTSAPFEMPPLSSKRLEFTSAQVQAGWGRLQSSKKLGGVVLYQIVDRISKEIKRETSILPSVEASRFAAYFNVNQETGVAAAYPGNQRASVTARLVDDAGSPVGQTAVLFPHLPAGQLGPQEHRARFVDSSLLGPWPQSFKQGALLIESNQNLIGTGVKTEQGVVSSSLLMTGEAGTASNNYLAQLGVGPIGGNELRSVVLLVNNNPTPAREVSVEFFDDEGGPLAAKVDGQQWPGTPLDIPATSARAMVLSSDSAVQAGWARIRSVNPLGSLVLYDVVNSTTHTLSRETSILPSQKAKRFATYFNPREETGLAVANPNDQAAVVRLKLIDYVGGIQRVVKDLPLFPDLPNSALTRRQHRARFITADFLGNLPANFSEGTIVLEADREVIVAVIKTKQGVVLSALPLAAEP